MPLTNSSISPSRRRMKWALPWVFPNSNSSLRGAIARQVAVATFPEFPTANRSV